MDLGIGLSSLSTRMDTRIILEEELFGKIDAHAGKILAVFVALEWLYAGLLAYDCYIRNGDTVYCVTRAALGYAGVQLP